MTFWAVTLLALVALTSARQIDLEDVINLEEITAYGYHTKVGGPLAEKIRKAEEEAAAETGPFPASLGQFPYQVRSANHVFTYMYTTYLSKQSFSWLFIKLT